MNLLFYRFMRSLGLIFIIALVSTACMRPVKPISPSVAAASNGNICVMLKRNPEWFDAVREVKTQWGTPIELQMAIMSLESGFNAQAKPKRSRWNRNGSTAFGYSQALVSTWNVFKRSVARPLARRDSFADSVDFIGWYTNNANRTAKIPMNNAFSQYLAYHEGVQGYQKRTYLRKPAVLALARRAQSRANQYRSQLTHCRG